jgi:hypothetical protein
MMLCKNKEGETEDFGVISDFMKEEINDSVLNTLSTLSNRPPGEIERRVCSTMLENPDCEV